MMPEPISTRPQVVGSIGSAAALEHAEALGSEALGDLCDVVEIRLDRLPERLIGQRPWRRWSGLPLLFTARAEAEGGAPGLPSEERARRLQAVLDEASMIDIELASAPQMEGLLAELRRRSVPWLASFHDFRHVPTAAELEARREAAREAGAWGFKAAIELGWQAAAVGALGDLLSRQDGFPVSLMGMGPLAAGSRLIFAQLGSVLNYGYLGNEPTAPGQWSAARLSEALGTLSLRQSPAIAEPGR